MLAMKKSASKVCVRVMERGRRGLFMAMMATRFARNFSISSGF
jgi:hypothetical protein